MMPCVVGVSHRIEVRGTLGMMEDKKTRAEVVEWLLSVQSFEVWVFNVFPELAALIIHGYKTAEARQTLHVHNLAARPWVGLWANPKRMYHGKAGECTWQVDLQASDIDIENMTTSQLLSLRTMPHTDMSGVDHLCSK